MLPAREPYGIQNALMKEICMSGSKGAKTPSTEEAVASRERERYVLRLYVTGMTPRSTAAVESIRNLCENHLSGRYELEIIDLYQQPILAEGEQIIAAPTLIKKLPLPLRRIIGDMSDSERILVGLDLRPPQPK
jgi:circadian clock protein KaiB